MIRLRALGGDARGVVYVEFLIAFVPVFLLCLGILQYALGATAQLVVTHAAWAGARAAIVILDDDPAHYGDPVGTLSPDESDASGDAPGWEQLLLSALAAGSLESPASPGAPSRRGGPRLSAIRRAVSRPLSVLAPDPTELASRLSGDVHRPVSATLGTGASRIGVGLATYNDWAAAVTFPQGAGAAQLHVHAVPGEADMITVRVTYLYRCAVPVVAALMCDSITASALRGAAEGAFAELSRVPSPLGLAALLRGGGYHRVLRAEASLPRQSAGYSYTAAGG